MGLEGPWAAVGSSHCGKREWRDLVGFRGSRRGGDRVSVWLWGGGEVICWLGAAGGSGAG